MIAGLVWKLKKGETLKEMKKLHGHFRSAVSTMIFAVVICIAVIETTVGQIAGPSSAPQTSATSGTKLLQGTGEWNVDLLRDMYKKKPQPDSVDVQRQPAPFPGQEMLKTLNPEFANRINVLVAIYQSHGGANLGIEPGTGGLRSRQSQINLYKVCRRLAKDAKGKPIGDGSKKSDWEEVPKAERNATNCAGGRIVTEEMVGWHNLGLAADFCYFSNGACDSQKSPFGTNNAGRKTIDAFVDLGMRWGGWFKTLPDPGHLEWHPSLHKPEAMGTPGTPLNNDEINNAVYKWKIPQTIFIWDRNVDNPAVGSQLTVYDLIVFENWFYLKDTRTLQGQKDGTWGGIWYSFAPPIKLFPSYIPTTIWAALPREGDHETKVTLREYQQFEVNGTINHGKHEITTGVIRYALNVGVMDLQKVANTKAWQHSGDQDPYENYQDGSVYRVMVKGELPSDTNVPPATHKGIEFSEGGYTSAEWTNSTPLYGMRLDLQMGWNRDDGSIGPASTLLESDSARPVYYLKELMCYDSGTCTVYSGSLPKGAWDKEEPPPWPAVNQKPKEKTKSTGGFIRP